MTTRLIVSYVRRYHGEQGVRRLLQLAGEQRPAEALEDELGWSTYRQKVALFEAAALLTGDEDVARRIGAALLSEQLAAPLKLVIGALGSPQQVLRSCARANAKFSTNSIMEALESGPGRAVVTYRVVDGYVPDRHDCLYTQGVLSQASVLFDLPPATIVERDCQVEGAVACCYEVTWQRRRRRLARLRGAGPGRQGSEVATLQERVADLEDTVSDLVSSRDLDEVLARIATRAGAAVRGQRFLLAVELAGESRPRIHSDGFGADTATKLGAGLLADPSRGVAGQDQLVAVVASSRRSYGYLAAYLPARTGFLPHEQVQLDAYGRLAAAAIDSATALADARRGQASSAAVLALARELANQRDEASVAERVVLAVPRVVACDRASLLLQDEVDGRLRVVAAHGFGELTSAALAFEMGLESTPELAAMIATPTPQLFTTDDPDVWVRGVMADFDAVALAVAPIAVRGSFAGLVVANWAAGTTLPAHHDSLLEGLAGLADHAGLAIAGIRLLDQAQHQATHDPLTGLANRALLDERLHRLVDDRRRGDVAAAICFIDLDGFKQVNDTLGHEAGDQVLVEVAVRIRARVRDADLVARVAGDEFVVVLSELRRPDDAEQVARGLVASLAEPFEVAGTSVRIGASIGVAHVAGHGATAVELLRAADGAMYRAKSDGSGHRVAPAQVGEPHGARPPPPLPG